MSSLKILTVVVTVRVCMTMRKGTMTPYNLFHLNVTMLQALTEAGSPAESRLSRRIREPWNFKLGISDLA
jgi:hypothetical protein